MIVSTSMLKRLGLLDLYLLHKRVLKTLLYYLPRFLIKFLINLGRKRKRRA